MTDCFCLKLRLFCSGLVDRTPVPIHLRCSPIYNHTPETSSTRHATAFQVLRRRFRWIYLQTNPTGARSLRSLHGGGGDGTARAEAGGRGKRAHRGRRSYPASQRGLAGRSCLCALGMGWGVDENTRPPCDQRRTTAEVRKPSWLLCSRLGSWAPVGFALPDVLP